jgi:hypothetical protein
MIALGSNCLVFKLATGESVPYSPDMLSAEMLGESSDLFDAEFVTHAAKAVFHYFKYELGRQTVSVGEFTAALEKVLRGFALSAQAAPETAARPVAAETDLCRLATASGKGCELFFFQILRDELRLQMRAAPRLVRFRGLRGCVKQLIGAQRWSLRCRCLEEQIVGYLRECLTAEAGQREFSLVVE